MRSRCVRAAVVLLLGTVACSDPSGPALQNGLVFAIGGEGNSVWAVDPVAGKVVARMGPVPSDKGAPTWSADSSTLFFAAGDRSGAAIFAINTHHARVQRWLDITIATAPQMTDGLWLTGRALGSIPGDPALYLAEAYSVNPTTSSVPDNDGRLALLDTSSQHVTGTITPLELHDNGFATLPPGSYAPHGALLAIGTRLRNQPLADDWLFVIDPATHTITDSAAITRLDGGAGGGLNAVLAAPDGRHVYLLGRDGTLYGYDLLAHQLFGRAQTTSDRAHLALSPDGQRLYSVDAGVILLFVPPSSSIEVFDASTLAPLPAIDLVPQPALNGERPIVHDIAVSKDGASLYLAAGTQQAASDQSLHILVMDRATGVVQRIIPLGGTGTVTLAVGR